MSRSYTSSPPMCLVFENKSVLKFSGEEETTSHTYAGCGKEHNLLILYAVGRQVKTNEFTLLISVHKVKKGN
jgi:hypothetical protein